MSFLLIGIVGAICYLVYRHVAAAFSFVRRGIAFQPPWPLFGNYAAVILQRETMVDTQVRLYNQFKGKRLYGVFDFHRPMLYVRDPALIRDILVVHFEHFVDHHPISENFDSDPTLGRMLFMMRSGKWRRMRSALTPAFTANKLRGMFALITATATETCDVLVAEAQKQSQQRRPYVAEMKDVSARYTNDIIANVAYGIRINSQRDRDNTFYRRASEFVNFRSWRTLLTVTAVSCMPVVSRWLGIRIVDGAIVAFFDRIVTSEIERRRRSDSIPRSDMIQQMLEAQQSKALDSSDLPAQCLMFFIAGNETVSSLLAFAIHELMANPAAQRSAIAEVDAVREALNGDPLTFDTLAELRYLECVLAETLRMWPSQFFTNRECRLPYEMTDDAGRTVRLEPGDGVVIPLYALHHDAAHFRDPERFDPARFGDERKHEIGPFTYLPFGAGQRSCIGMRFTMAVCKTFLFHLLEQFSLERSAERTRTPVRLLGNRFVLVTRDGLHVELRQRCV